MTCLRRSMVRSTLRALPALALAALLAACGSTPVANTWIGPSPELMVGEIRAVGVAAPGDLDVQPLRDPMVEDLRVQAARAERAKRYADAATALDKAMSLAPEDPALLQERAEVAVFQKNLPEAERLARRAFALGGKVGPLCRRHWMTIRQSLAQHQSQLLAMQNGGHLKGAKLTQWEDDMTRVASDLELARRAQEDCTQTGPPRY